MKDGFGQEKQTEWASFDRMRTRRIEKQGLALRGYTFTFWFGLSK